MSALLPRPVDAIRKGLESVLASACANGAPSPPWVAVDDGSDRWVALVAARPRAERRVAAVAVSSDRALVTAHRLGIGGAFSLPPSTLAAFGALTVASAGSLPQAPASFENLGILEGRDPMHVVRVAASTFWCCQLGETALTALFAELASQLEIPPVILPWPALVTERLGVDAILGAWGDLRSKHGGPIPDLVVAPLQMNEGTVLASVYAALLGAVDQTVPTTRIEPVPVTAISSGGPVGCWATHQDQSTGAGWMATPTEVTAARCRWRVQGEGMTGSVEDVVTTDELNAARDALAVRVPGWLTDHLRPGTPAFLLLSNLAEGAARRGIPLWVPNVDAEALQMVLRLPGVLWVDGPAVPRSP